MVLHKSLGAEKYANDVRVEDELLTYERKTNTYLLLLYIYTSFGFIWDIEIQPEKRRTSP